MKAYVQKNSYLLVDVLRILCAFLLPPLSVGLTVGLTRQFRLNILLTLLGYLPGMVHAIWLLTARADAGLVGAGEWPPGPLRSRRSSLRRLVARRVR